MIKKNIGLIFIFLFILTIGNEVYKQVTTKPKSAKSTRLSCHKKSITFEKLLQSNLVHKLHQTLKSDEYKLIVWADKAKYMKSVMFDYVNITDIKNSFRQQIKEYQLNIQPQKTADVVVDVMIYENDKKDPGKKTARSKRYAGYIEVGIKVDKKNVYKIQTDFMNLKGTDIPQRISCIVKSIMTLGDKK